MKPTTEQIERAKTIAEWLPERFTFRRTEEDSATGTRLERLTLALIAADKLHGDGYLGTDNYVALVEAIRAAHHDITTTRETAATLTDNAPPPASCRHCGAALTLEADVWTHDHNLATWCDSARRAPGSPYAEPAPA